MYKVSDSSIWYGDAGVFLEAWKFNMLSSKSVMESGGWVREHSLQETIVAEEVCTEKLQDLAWLARGNPVFR